MTTMNPRRKTALRLAFLAALAAGVVLSLLVVGSPQARGQTPAPSDDEAAVLGLISDYRSQHGLSTLKVSPTLTAAARWMSEDIADHNCPGHTDSLGRSPLQRMIAFGYTGATMWGEIIQCGAEKPEEAFEAWRTSPSHNDVMLKAGFVVAGVGKVYNPQSLYRYFWTVDFGDYDDSLAGSPTPTPSPSPTPSRTPSPTPSPTPAASPAPTPTPGRMVGCPTTGRWSLAVWSGGDATPTGEALATCAPMPVEAAYWLDPETQGWLRYFAGRPEFNTLLTLDNLQAVLALGAQPAP